MVDTSGQPDTSVYNVLTQQTNPMAVPQGIAEYQNTLQQNRLMRQELINRQIAAQQQQQELQLKRLDQVGGAASGLLAQYAGQGGIPQEALTSAITNLRATGAIDGNTAATLLQQTSSDPAANYQLVQQHAARMMGARATLEMAAHPQNDTTGYQSLYGTQGGIMGAPGQFGRFTPASGITQRQQVSPTGRTLPGGQQEIGTQQQQQELASGNGGGVQQYQGLPGQPQTEALPPVGVTPGKEGHGYAGGLPTGMNEQYQTSAKQYQDDMAHAGGSEYQQFVSAGKQILSNLDKADTGQASDAKSWLRNFAISSFPDSWKKSMGLEDQDSKEVAFEKIQKYLARMEITQGNADKYHGTSYQIDMQNLANPNVKNVKEALKDLVRFNIAQTQYEAAKPQAYLADHAGDQQDAAANSGRQYTNYKTSFNQMYDPRAIYYAQLSPQEQKSYMAEYGSKMSDDEKAKFNATYKLLRDRLPQMGYFQDARYKGQ